MKKILLFILPLLFSISFLSSCGDDDDPMVSLTIAQTASETASLSTLVSALDRADLYSTLNGNGSFTVFAPTNDAFNSFLSGLGFSSVDDVPVDVLSNILLNHVVSGEQQSTDLSTGYISSLGTSLTDRPLSLFINTSDGVRVNGLADVVQADIAASNGVVHVVDAIINTADVVGQAIANPTFSTLVSALSRSDLSTNLVAALQGDGPFTVFAPTDAAFSDLLTMLGVSSLNDIDAATLEAVLTYHVLAGAEVFGEDLANGPTPATLQGESLTIDLSGGAKINDATMVSANVVATDVTANNGVIHAIDKVLLPEAVYDNIAPSIVDFAVGNDDYSSLVAALQRTNLVATLDQTQDLTVFAPDNAAFNRFLQANGFSTLNEVPVGLLEQVLLNHVVGGVNRSTDLNTGYVSSLATTSSGNTPLSMYISVDNGVRINGQSDVQVADINVRNGVIHGVSEVIGLPSVVTFATANPQFGTLVSALTRSDLTTDFVGILSSEGPFTVFAPTNDAFSDVLSELNLNGLGDIPTGTLDAVLRYHVVSGANIRAEDITDGMDVSAIGGNFNISTSNGVVITDSRSRMTNVVATDVQAINGVIHVVDQVLLP